MKLTSRWIVGILFLGAFLQAAEVPLAEVQKALEKPAAHPRLLWPVGTEEQIRARMAADPAARAIFEHIQHEADSLMEQPPIERVQIGRRLLDKSRTCIKRVLTLSFMYRMTGKEAYFQRAEKEMLAAAAFSDWNPSHFLDVAEMTTALAIGYDWLYDKLSPTSRETIRRVIVDKGLVPSLETKDDLSNLQSIKKSIEKRMNTWWVVSTNNWNQVCNGGMTLGALAVLEDEPQLATQIVHRAVGSVPRAMGEYNPDGAYPEGPSYWVYGTSYNILLIDALNAALKTDFGLSEHKGFQKTGDYFVQMTGPTGLFFNYADCGQRGGGIYPEIFWFARHYDRPDWMWGERPALERYRTGGGQGMSGGSRFLPMTLIWMAQNEPVKPAILCWKGDGNNPVAVLRTGWDNDSLYIAIKGGRPAVNHGHMDIGSFVLDVDGVRWALDLGSQDYNRIEQMGISLFNMRQDSQRWQIMRYTNLWHNTLSVDEQLQRVEGFAPITQFLPDSPKPRAVVDMSRVYAGQLNTAMRSVQIAADKTTWIHDRVEASDKNCTVRWSMVTPADVEIQSNGTALLKRDGKTLYFAVRSLGDPSIKIPLQAWSTEPKSKLDEPNRGTRILGFEIPLKANQTMDYYVIMAPLAAGQTELPHKDYQPVAWPEKTKK
ncbi:MAG: heparinase II/III family protein [Anaerohalosphaeraceae bacterium]